MSIDLWFALSYWEMDDRSFAIMAGRSRCSSSTRRRRIAERYHWSTGTEAEWNVATVDTYDAIGRSYSTRRRPDQRLAARLDALIGGDSTVLNVGAGTGSYEPARSGVVAVEPSTVMLSQRPASAAPAVRAIAEALPFPDQAFDVVLAILTVSNRCATFANSRRLH